MRQMTFLTAVRINILVNKQTNQYSEMQSLKQDNQQEQAASMSFIDESSCNTSVPGDIEAMPVEVPMEYDSDASVWVDCSQANELPMLKCTPAFYTYLGGPSLRENAHLMSWVHDNDFEGWVRTYIRERQPEPDRCCARHSPRSA